MARTITVTTEGVGRTFQITTGVGPTGPNVISTSTATAFDGLIAGNGSTAQLATTAQKESVVNDMTTITGAKTFSGQVEHTGQAATGDDSAMTRELVAARTRYSRLASNVVITSSTTVQAIVSLSVVAGKNYRVFGVIDINGTTNTGTKHGYITPSGTIRFTRKRASSYSPITAPNSSFEIGLAESSTIGEFEGIYECAASGDLELVAAQNTSHADSMTVTTFTFLMLTEF